MKYEIEEAGPNTYLISEDFGFRYWIWFDDLEVYNKSKLTEYARLPAISKKHFPGRVSEVSIIAFKDSNSGHVKYLNDNIEDSNVEVNEEKLETMAYGIKEDSTFRFFSVESLSIFGIDCDD